MNADNALVFTEKALRQIVSHIATTTHALLEIVNFNVDGEQYVCAGTVSHNSCQII